MDISLQLKSLSDKTLQMKDQIETEEGTKTAFVLPFINLLGYDIFNPTEVTPEFTADLGLKKGEKVDYAIFQNGNPILIIECKHWKENLNVHNSQLFRYFHVTKTRFALLTNGIVYRFYSDLEAANKMDEKPFLEFDLTNLKESVVGEISKFHKSNFDVEKIISNASALKFIGELKKEVGAEMANPSNELIRHFTTKVYNGRLTEKVLEQFKDFVTKALNQHISEKVNDRLTAALTKENESQSKEEIVLEEDLSKVDTTEEELEAFQIVVAILRRVLPKSRIVFRDTQSYFGILLDDNNRKPICRLHLNGGKKYMSLFGNNKTEIKEAIDSVDDIYKFENVLLETIKMYEEVK
jgi:predicted type IV restriction endonuclease